MRDGLAKLGAVPAGGSPEDFKKMIDAETSRWAGIVQAAHIEKLD